MTIDLMCACMMGPNDPDPKCDQCGGTGHYVSDERIADLRSSYAYLVEHSRKGIGIPDLERQRILSDEQHLALLCELQAHRQGAAMTSEVRHVSFGSQLSAGEAEVIANLVAAWNAFVALPVEHPDDTGEFRTLIHHAQDKILSRPTRRGLKAEVGL